MKKSIFHLSIWFLMVGLAVTGCSKKADEHDMHHGHDEAESTGPNNQLYEDVMAVHNEVMPKMDEVFKIKEKLKNKIATEQDMKADEKLTIEATISRLDSAGEGMMVWMRQFNPPPDSLGEEQAKAYLEEEMVKVKKVKDDILQAINDGNGLMQ